MTTLMLKKNHTLAWVLALATLLSGPGARAALRTLPEACADGGHTFKGERSNGRDQPAGPRHWPASAKQAGF